MNAETLTEAVIGIGVCATVGLLSNSVMGWLGAILMGIAWGVTMWKVRRS